MNDMAQLIITRQKAMVGMAVQMNCYVNGEIVCKLKNGETKNCEIGSGSISFKCGLSGNPISDTIFLNLDNCDYIEITVKQGMWNPQITVVDPSACVNGTPSTNCYSDSKCGFSTSPFTPTKNISNYFAIDEHSRRWAIGKGLIPSFKNVTPYSYDDIIDFELIEDGDCITKGGLGSAVVGGLFFGGAGAVVGSVTGAKKTKRTCTNLSIKITVNNAFHPIEYIKLITSSTDRNSFIYKAAFQNAQEIISLLQIICTQRTDGIDRFSPTLSPADEIRKYKALMDDGIITEEEFREKKRQLLDL